MSYCLSERSIDHVLLERGEVANSWRTERWDSLTLLTPNWQSRLPGYGYEGNDPDGYRNVSETVSFLQRYADIVSAPVITGANVSSVTRDDWGYTVQTDQGQWHCRSVVIASGACNIATVPAVAQAIPGAIESVTAMDYRNPHQLPPRRRARRRRISHWHPACRRNSPLGPAGNPSSGRTHPGTSGLPRTRH